MFKKILIANRGEIACRVIRTAKNLGVKTVAVYSDADRSALHVELADEAVHIGASPVSESYLLKENIIAAALSTGAEAVHPGYGFLSENPDFVDAVEAAGLIFIGPSAASIRAMGLKDAAKALMEKAKVPVVPGYHGDMQEPGFLAAKANEIGFPVLIKARAGGGGKGMRRVNDARDFSSALASCRSEARSSFGDDRVLLEKYILNPRHIEVQVFGDNHGNVVHLYERDCSLQRRHQKVIEEAPAPGMTAEMREAMTSAAVTAAKAINYSGAGTIEFIVDGANGLRPDGFWFMEMNTRLQVEHPVTELITGLDLVEWQLRVASGEPLPLQQDDIGIEGHAFEARLYAEDVPKGFLPAIGTLEHLSFAPDARIDTGVVEKSIISPFYDPMIAKIIFHGKDRSDALDGLYAALRHTQVAGTVTNKDFLANLTRHQGFASGIVDTGLIERDIDQLTNSTKITREVIAIAALISLLDVPKSSGSDPYSLIGAFSLWGATNNTIYMKYAGEAIRVDVLSVNGNDYECLVAGENIFMPQCSIMCRHDASGKPVYKFSSGNKTELAYARWPNHVAIFDESLTSTFEIPDPLVQAGAQGAGSDLIISPMPGLVKKVTAIAGANVGKGDSLIVLEAMKMEHTLVAPRDGVLAEVNVREGDQVIDGAVLVALLPAAEEGKTP